MQIKIIVALDLKKNGLHREGIFYAGTDDFPQTTMGKTALLTLCLLILQILSFLLSNYLIYLSSNGFERNNIRKINKNTILNLFATKLYKKG